MLIYALTTFLPLVVVPGLVAALAWRLIKSKRPEIL